MPGEVAAWCLGRALHAAWGALHGAWGGCCLLPGERCMVPGDGYTVPVLGRYFTYDGARHYTLEAPHVVNVFSMSKAGLPCGLVFLLNTVITHFTTMSLSVILLLSVSLPPPSQTLHALRRPRTIMKSIIIHDVICHDSSFMIDAMIVMKRCSFFFVIISLFGGVWHGWD